MSFTLPTTEEKAEYVLNQFDRIARGYDLTNNAISLGMHHLWKNRAIKELELKPGGRYLDVCCGTGDLTLLIAKSVGLTGNVIGLDFSPNMLLIAEQRKSREEQAIRTSVQFMQGDALNLPFEDGYFDGAIVSFGLRNLIDYQKGIDEMARVVKPGGHVINLDLGRSTVPGFAQVFAFYFRHIVPVIGAILQSDRQAYTYLPESMNAYPDPKGITELFANSGLDSICHIPLALGTVALHRSTVSNSRSKTC